MEVTGEGPLQRAAGGVQSGKDGRCKGPGQRLGARHTPGLTDAHFPGEAWSPWPGLGGGDPSWYRTQWEFYPEHEG